jgi:hypothetical protein
MSILNRFSMPRTRHSRRTPALRLLALAACAAALGTAHADERRQAAPWCAERCDQVVIDWNATAYQVIKASDGYADPMAASRTLAMVHLAMHDAVNGTRPRYASYTQVQRDDAADAAVAAVTAAHDVLAALYPKEPVATLLKTALDTTLFEAGIGASVTRGQALGKRVAAAVLQRRAGDGANATQDYQPGTRPGEYRFTPGFDFLAAPHWRNVQPFALSAPSQYRSAPPPALDSAEYTRAFIEVKETGSKAADAKRTPDQTHYAAWWYEFSDIGWNRIARTVARERSQDLWQRARTFALLNVAMADSYIAGWDSKMHYNLWRPVTAIRLADSDGNRHTLPDAAFTPLLPTPPVQDYPSTHSALGAAAAVVLAHAFGADRIAFQAASSSALPANPVRRFASFSEAARENADSRVRAGIHFRFATVAGLEMGEQVGRHAVQHTLAPLH